MSHASGQWAEGAGRTTTSPSLSSTCLRGCPSQPLPRPACQVPLVRVEHPALRGVARLAPPVGSKPAPTTPSMARPCWPSRVRRVKVA